MNEILRQIIAERLIPLEDRYARPPVPPLKITPTMIAVAATHRQAKRTLDRTGRRLKALGVDVSTAGKITRTYAATQALQSAWQNARREKIDKIKALRLQAQIDLIGMTLKQQRDYFRDLRKKLAKI